jgi:hypothetical protein
MSNPFLDDDPSITAATPRVANGNPFLDDEESTSADPTITGEITNDVGNRVIVPKAGESFTDVMKRAAAAGKRTTPAMLNKEEATIPTKAGQVLAAAPIAGAVGAATLALPGLAPEGAKALETLAKAHPVVAKIVGKGLEALGIGAGVEAMRKILK